MPVVTSDQATIRLIFDPDEWDDLHDIAATHVLMGPQPVEIQDFLPEQGTTPAVFVAQMLDGLIQQFRCEKHLADRYADLEANGHDPTHRKRAKTKGTEPTPVPTFQFNPDYDRRDSILKLRKSCWRNNPYGVVDFAHLHVSRLEQLFDERFIDPDDRQNESPRFGDFLELMKKHRSIHASGHTYSPDRDCPGVVLTGIHIPDLISAEDKAALILFSVTADELEIGTRIRAWWD